MKTLYQAANAVEAHMLLDLLKQEGISGHIFGEHLQGAIGELPANGLVRLVVDEGDYASARTVIDRWAIKNPPEANQAVVQAKSRGWLGLLISFAVGVVGCYAFFRAPATTDGIDFNRDGVLDEKWTFSASGTILKSEVDRNLDGRVDYVTTFDKRGQLQSAEADDNFDGVFETHIGFRDGNTEWYEVDTDGDGYPDLRTNYESGVMVSTEYISPISGKPLRVEFFRLGVMFKANVDTDKDGVLDTTQNYSRLGEVLSVEKLKK